MNYFHHQVVGDTLYYASDETLPEDNEEAYTLWVNRVRVAVGLKTPADVGVRLYALVGDKQADFIAQKRFEDRRPLGQWMAETYHDHTTKGAKS